MLCTLVDNARDDLVEGVEDGVVGEADDAPALGFEPGLADAIRDLRREMGLAVDLDDELVFGAAEVGDVRPDHELAAELRAGAVCAESAPEEFFGEGLIGAQGLCEAS